MKELKKQVAVIVDSNGKCKYLGKVLLVDQAAYNKFLNESNQIEAEKHKKKLEFNEKLNAQEQKIEDLETKVRKLLGEE